MMRKRGEIHSYKYFIAFTAILILLFSGCSSPMQISNSDLEKYNVEKKVDENSQGDFVFQLVSEKQEYAAGDNVKLYGEITYVGDKGEVDIYHSSSAMLFPMEEKIRGFDIGFTVNNTPGDRLSECKGLMKPIALDYSAKKGHQILHQCVKCKKTQKNKVATDTVQEDNIIQLMYQLQLK